MKEKITSLLKEQVQCVLGTQGKGQLGLHLMAYDFSADLNNIYIASFEQTQKVNNMRSNVDVTLLWDNRKGNNADHNTGFAISGFGKAREIHGEEAQSVALLLERRNETLQPLLADSQAVVFTIEVDRYQWVEGYTGSVIYTPPRC